MSLGYISCVKTDVYFLMGGARTGCFLRVGSRAGHGGPLLLFFSLFVVASVVDIFSFIKSSSLSVTR